MKLYVNSWGRGAGKSYTIEQLVDNLLSKNEKVALLDRHILFSRERKGLSKHRGNLNFITIDSDTNNYHGLKTSILIFNEPFSNSLHVIENIIQSMSPKEVFMYGTPPLRMSKEWVKYLLDNNANFNYKSSVDNKENLHEGILLEFDRVKYENPECYVSQILGRIILE